MIWANTDEEKIVQRIYQEYYDEHCADCPGDTVEQHIISAEAEMQGHIRTIIQPVKTIIRREASIRKIRHTIVVLENNTWRYLYGYC